MLSLKGRALTILNSSSSRNLNLCSSLGDAVVLRQKLLPLKDMLIVVIIIITIMTIIIIAIIMKPDVPKAEQGPGPDRCVLGI